MRLPHGGCHYTASCGIRTKWSSGRRTHFIPLGNTEVFLCLFLHILFVLALEQDRGVDCSRQICSWPRFVRDISSRFRAISSWRSTYEFVTNFIWILVSRSWFRSRTYVSNLTRREVTFHHLKHLSRHFELIETRLRVLGRVNYFSLKNTWKPLILN